MHLYERQISVPVNPEGNLLSHLARHVSIALEPGEVAVRLAVTDSTTGQLQCELGVFGGAPMPHSSSVSILDFARRSSSRASRFNVVFIVPTGVGAEIGGHAGDAAPAARLLAEVSDTLLTHPNVVNASDVNELPANGLYVEGSVLSRVLMGTAGVQPARSNRVLVVIDEHDDPLFVNAAINTVNGARSAYGLDCSRVVKLMPPVRMTAEFAPSGRAAGRVEQLDSLFDVLEKYRGEYDAVALSSVISVPHQYHSEYFDKGGEMVNPWGGVEAMLTHAVSEVFGVPTAHAPMFESREIANMDPGEVDPRMASEAVSLTFLQCVLKGLAASPRIVSTIGDSHGLDAITARDISCLVIPDGCLGLPTLAALEQGIAVVAVKENKNLMRNDLEHLPWSPGQFFQVDNYWEAAGVVGCIRAGLPPSSVRRPLPSVEVSSKTEWDSDLSGDRQDLLEYPAGRRQGAG